MPSTHKPSLSLPATAPNTPANARTNRYVVPVTPQRSLHSKSLSLAQNKPQNQNQNRAQSQSAYQPRTRTVHHSPSTPSASPYTPLSLRSVNTSNTYSTPYSYSSSNVTTPGSAHSNIVGKRLILAGLSSAEDKEKAGKDKSLADIAENWRSRANENGIRVSSSECGIDADDEASDRTNASRVKIPLGRGFQANSNSNEQAQSDNPLGPGYVSAETLLPPPFLSTHRRPRAQSHSQTQSVSYPSAFSASPSPNPVFYTPQPKPRPPRAAPSNLSVRAGEYDEEDYGYGYEFDSFSFSQEHELDQSLELDQSFFSPGSTSPEPQLRTPLRALRPNHGTPTHGIGNVTMGHPYTPPQHAQKAALRMKMKGSLTEPPVLKASKMKFLGGRARGTDLFDISEDFVAGLEYEDEGEMSFVGGGYEGGYPETFFSPAKSRGLGMSGGVGMGMGDLFFPAIQQQQQQQYQCQYQGGYQQQYQAQHQGQQWQGERHQEAQQHSPSHSLSFSAAHSLSHPLSPTFSAAYTQSDSPYSLPPPASFPVSSGSDLLPSAIPPPAHSPPTPAAPAHPGTCTICARVPTPAAPSYAVLLPCAHALCSTCLTGALNIVGEKDMECGVCKGAVGDFRLVGGLAGAGVSSEDKDDKKVEEGDKKDKEIGDKAVEKAKERVVEEEGSAFEFFEDARARSSPPPGRVMSPVAGGENAVLRIDNVPWDITPPQIRTWLGNPPSLVGVHVLLDRRGKTLSHAFVEFADEGEARRGLRGAQRNAVLGKGRRARGVTVTRSGQEELMRSLFPSWKGSFCGSRPSLVGLANPHVIAALETGLITEHELTALLHLIRSPDAHFLKVPALPFHSLVSVLAKFPADVDSRVFWSTGVRDRVFEVASAALQVLLWRVNGGGEGDKGKDEEREREDVELVAQVFEAAVHCAAFTPHQVGQLTALIEGTPYSCADSASFLPQMSPLPDSQAPPMHVYRESYTPRPPQMRHDPSADTAFGALAREFGLETQLVQALAHRLAAY